MDVEAVPSEEATLSKMSCIYCGIGLVESLPAACPNCGACLTIEANSASFDELHAAAQRNAHIPNARLSADGAKWLRFACAESECSMSLAE